jgi:DNA-binding winged helix-turn-helix (wHTH) protein
MSLRRNSGDSRTTWIFGSCELDELSRRFRVDGKLVELETKPLEVLRQLLLRAGEVVTKQELLDLVWPGLVVVDGSLATAVSKLRKALNDRDATMIATVARVGYRLEATVRVRHTGEPNCARPASRADCWRNLDLRGATQEVTPNLSRMLCRRFSGVPHLARRGSVSVEQGPIGALRPRCQFSCGPPISEHRHKCRSRLPQSRPGGRGGHRA